MVSFARAGPAGPGRRVCDGQLQTSNVNTSLHARSRPVLSPSASIVNPERPPRREGKSPSDRRGMGWVTKHGHGRWGALALSFLSIIQSRILQRWMPTFGARSGFFWFMFGRGCQRLSSWSHLRLLSLLNNRDSQIPYAVSLEHTLLILPLASCFHCAFHIVIVGLRRS